MDTRIYHKSSSQHQVLSASSLRALHTHKTWLHGRVTRAFRLCSSKTSALQEVQHLCMVGARMGIDYAEQLIPSCPPAPSHRIQFDGITSRVILAFFRHWRFGCRANVVFLTNSFKPFAAKISPLGDPREVPASTP